MSEIYKGRYTGMIKIPFIFLIDNFSLAHIPSRGLFILDATPLQKGTSCVVHKIELHTQEECMINDFIMPW